MCPTLNNPGVYHNLPRWNCHKLECTGPIENYTVYLRKIAIIMAKGFTSGYRWPIFSTFGSPMPSQCQPESCPGPVSQDWSLGLLWLVRFWLVGTLPSMEAMATDWISCDVCPLQNTLSRSLWQPSGEYWRAISHTEFLWQCETPEFQQIVIMFPILQMSYIEDMYVYVYI